MMLDRPAQALGYMAQVFGDSLRDIFLTEDGAWNISSQAARRHESGIVIAGRHRNHRRGGAAQRELDA